MRLRTWLFGTAALINACIPAVVDAQSQQLPTQAPLGPTTSDAAVAAGGNDSALGEIVVTAQRRTENLQSVPIAATALSGAQLQSKAVTSLTDLQFAAPGLQITQGGTSQSVNIRGIGIASGSPAVQNGVASYIDGVFQTPIAQNSTFYDIASVEVLRGPQGTLVGANSTGGAVFINTQRPVLDRIEGYGEGTFGNYKTGAVQGAINVPVSSTLAVRAAGNFRRRDSYYTNLGPADVDPGRLNEKAGRIGVLFKTGSFQALAKVELTDRNTGGFAYKPVPGTTYAAFSVPGEYNLNYNSGPTRNHERSLQSDLELRYVTDGGVTFRSLAAYQNKRLKNLEDRDAVTPALNTQDQFVRERIWTEEVNIISPTTGAFDWIVGGYYQHNKIDVVILQRAAGFPTNVDSITDKKTTGVFAQGNYKIVSNLEFQLGVRYSHFKSATIGAVKIGNGIPGFPAGGRQVANLGGAYADGRVTGKAALNWQVNDANLLYAFAARGYKAGGFNSATSSFGPETVWDYEIGWKSTMFDRHIRTQIGGYYNDYKNFQFGDVDLATGQTGQLRNLSNAVVKGFEGQIQGKFGGFGFDGGVAYVNSSLSSVSVVNTRLLPAGTLGPQCPVGVASNPPTCFNYTPFTVNNSGGPNLYSPKWTYNVGAQYRFEVADEVFLTPRLNYAYVGPSFVNILYSPVTDKLQARGLLSAQLTLERHGWTVQGFGTNLTNKYYSTGQSGNNAFFGAPREYGVRVGVRF